MICPTCQCDTLDPGLSVSLDAEEMCFAGERRALTRDQAKIMHALLRRFALVLSFDSIANLLWGDRVDGGPENTIGVIRAQLSYIRRKLRGWPFVIVCSYTAGYSLCRRETLVTDGGPYKARKSQPFTKQAPLSVSMEVA